MKRLTSVDSSMSLGKVYYDAGAVWFHWIMHMYSTISWRSAVWTTEAGGCSSDLLSRCTGLTFHFAFLFFLTTFGITLLTVTFIFFSHFSCAQGCEGLEPIPAVLGWRWILRPWKVSRSSQGQSRQTEKYQSDTHSQWTIWSWQLTSCAGRWSNESWNDANSTWKTVRIRNETHKCRFSSLLPPSWLVSDIGQVSAKKQISDC